MTRRQWLTLQIGDRVSWRGADVEEGTVVDVGAVVIVVWDRSGYARYSHSLYSLFELVPTFVEQVTR